MKIFDESESNVFKLCNFIVASENGVFLKKKLGQHLFVHNFVYVCPKLIEIIPKIQDDRDRDHIHSWQDAPAKSNGPMKSVQGDVKWQFLQVIF